MLFGKLLPREGNFPRCSINMRTIVEAAHAFSQLVAKLQRSPSARKIQR